MIVFTYGKHSNAFLLSFYGFCSPGNKYDSIRLLLTKVLKTEQKTNLNSIIQTLILLNASIEQRNKFMNQNIGTKIADYLDSQVQEIKLKSSRLSK